MWQHTPLGLRKQALLGAKWAYEAAPPKEKPARLKEWEGLKWYLEYPIEMEGLTRVERLEQIFQTMEILPVYVQHLARESLQELGVREDPCWALARWQMGRSAKSAKSALPTPRQ